MPRTRNDSVRERLLDAAISLFAERGYAATSIREIVEAAGVTKPALYYYYQSKEGIFRAILEEVERRALEIVAGSAATRGSTRERIERLFLSMHALFEREKTAVRFLNAVMWGPAQGIPRCDLLSIHEKFRREVERLVAQGIADGELRAVRPGDVARTLLAIISHHFDLALVFPRLASGKSGLKRDLDILFRGISPAAQTENAP